MEPEKAEAVWSDRYEDGNTGATATASFDGKTLTLTMTDPDLQTQYEIEQAASGVSDVEHAWSIGIKNGAQELFIGTMHLNAGGETAQVAPEEMETLAMYTVTEGDSTLLNSPTVMCVGKMLMWTLDVSGCAFPFDGAEIYGAVAYHKA